MRAYLAHGSVAGLAGLAAGLASLDLLCSSVYCVGGGQGGEEGEGVVSQVVYFENAG